MKPQIKHSLIVLLLIICSYSFGQIKHFHYKRQLSGISGTWNSIDIPDEMYAKLNPNLSDIRIIGFTKEGDTIEAPYILEELSEQTILNQVTFKILNFTKRGDRYYYTFEVPSVEVVNKIYLLFEEGNFDRQIRLEGSDQLSEWFTILNDYRILSIKNQFTDYAFTTLNFHTSKYRYYRLSFQSRLEPKLMSATISEQKILKGYTRDYNVLRMESSNDQKGHNTIITADLPFTVPVSYLKIDVKDTYDFYRPVYIQYMTDSIESQKGWIYNYSAIASGVLSSLEPAEFKFTNIFVRKLRIIISNNNNEPLTVDKIEIKGNIYRLIVRILKPANYYLVYNNENTLSPVYDLTSFKDRIPEGLSQLSIGPEERIDQPLGSSIKPIFENKAWLWVIMAVIIVLLGGFTFKMIKK